MIASEIEIKTTDALAGSNVLEECFYLGITLQGIIHSLHLHTLSYFWCQQYVPISLLKDSREKNSQLTSSVNDTFVSINL